MEIPSNRFWAIIFVVGVFTLSILLYAFFSTGDSKIEANDSIAGLRGEVVIFINDKAFNPQVTTVRSGTIVKWINNGAMPHSVTFGLNSSLENVTVVNQILAPSESLSYKFEKVGHFNFYDKNAAFSGSVDVR